MFNSNVSPKRRIRTLEDWLCEICNKTIKKYHAKCPTCGNTRPD